MGDVPKAESSYRQAIAGLDDLIKHEPKNPDFQRDLARADQGLGVLLKDANRYQQSEKELRQAIRLAQGNCAGAGCRRPGPSGPGRQPLPVGCSLGPSRRGRAEEAEYSAALAVQQELVQQYGDRPEYVIRLARYRNNLGRLQDASGHQEDAEATFRATLKLLEPAVLGPAALPGASWQLARRQ